MTKDQKENDIYDQETKAVIDYGICRGIAAPTKRKLKYDIESEIYKKQLETNRINAEQESAQFIQKFGEEWQTILNKQIQYVN